MSHLALFHYPGGVAVDERRGEHRRIPGVGCGLQKVTFLVVYARKLDGCCEERDLQQRPGRFNACAFRFKDMHAAAHGATGTVRKEATQLEYPAQPLEES